MLYSGDGELLTVTGGGEKNEKLLQKNFGHGALRATANFVYTALVDGSIHFASRRNLRHVKHVKVRLMTKT